MKVSSFIGLRFFTFLNIIIGVAFISIIASIDFKHQHQNRVITIINELNYLSSIINDEMFPSLKEIIEHKSCKAFISASNKLTYSYLFLRSVNIVSNMEIQCSTLSGDNIIKLNDSESSSSYDNEFYLPKSPFSNLKIQDDDGVFIVSKALNNAKSIYFAMHPEFIRKLVDTSTEVYKLDIAVGNYLVNDKKTQTSKISFESKDTSFDNVKVLSKLDFNMYSSGLISEYGLYILLWILFSLTISKSIYNSLSSFDTMIFNIRNGIKNREFEPYLQPVFNAEKKLIGVEVLVRWVRKSGEIVYPDKFIEVAERSGQIQGITTILFEKVIDELFHFNDKSGLSLHVAFNICPVQLADVILYDNCINFFDRLNNKNFFLILEVTEREAFPNGEIINSIVSELKPRGLKLAIDDFGTGHCSLKYIHQMDVDFIKIDKSYIDCINTGNKIEILENIIDLAKRLHVPMVAEGVENKVQYEYLISKGVDNFQGYLFERPLPLHDFIGKYLN
ncbi:EAL domain-containing protein [Shewanella sp. ZOR0012]|uniref:EAL domain-containing protein n=1 Tax=Shewanella sp. ZOR0012 TaxID=1339231 RepID=UPI00068BC993|nr:EAL domain-containing protein [Shewanella sp. ZOR0012]NSM23934.1 EAL domain-containing protein [Shewanella sp. ZOR0012]